MVPNFNKINKIPVKSMEHALSLEDIVNYYTSTFDTIMVFFISDTGDNTVTETMTGSVYKDINSVTTLFAHIKRSYTEIEIDGKVCLKEKYSNKYIFGYNIFSREAYDLFFKEEHNTVPKVEFNNVCISCSDTMTSIDDINNISIRIDWYECPSCKLKAEHNRSGNYIKFYR